MKNKIIILIFIFSIMFNLNNKNLVFALDDNIYITSHRGSCTIENKENTLSSISKAIEEGADYVEIDVRVTKDNKVIIYHDSNLKRIYKNNGKINNLTLKEIKEISKGNIPTLDEVFRKFQYKVKFNLELKVEENSDILYKNVETLIDKYNMYDYIIISSFNKDVLNKISSKIKKGYISSDSKEELYALDVEFLSLRYNLITKELIDKIHESNKEVYVWTVNDLRLLDELINCNVDNIITDDVVKIRKVIDGI